MSGTHDASNDSPVAVTLRQGFLPRNGGLVARAFARLNGVRRAGYCKSSPSTVCNLKNRGGLQLQEPVHGPQHTILPHTLSSSCVVDTCLPAWLPACVVVWCAGFADGNRASVCGGSHGGFLSGHLMGQYPQRFKCAGLRNPVLNIALMVGVTDIPDWCFIETYGTEVCALALACCDRLCQCSSGGGGRVGWPLGVLWWFLRL